MNTSRPLALSLNVIGAVVVTWSLLTSHSGGEPAWVLVVALVAIAAWVARAAVPARHDRWVLGLGAVAGLAGAVTTAPTNGILVVPAVVSLLALIGDTLRPLWHGLALSAVVLTLIPIGAVPFGTPPIAVLAMMAGALLAVFAGLSRRQYRRSEAQAAELRERGLALREEASRVAIARDLHDVLAHSLGGLVLQLDAVDALLEAGDTDAARTRVVDARSLAADGLAEARRAVGALRDPEAAASRVVAAEDVESALRELVAAHRAIGGVAELRVSGAGRPIVGEQAVALQRAMQEALSNARKHAPSASVEAALDWQTDGVLLTVSNALDDAAHPLLSRTGGGHGIDGMRERVSALPHGGRVTAGAHDGRFIVAVELVLG
ncbi:sensor histidine kinase [Leifsonia sp. SIMBA_070]|uniref:sensor histidine kinase n=1 Tax=Leifsonia sp. SIMBA_070 TaxID=3085810 RepID=UPI00397C6EA7